MKRITILVSNPDHGMKVLLEHVRVLVSQVENQGMVVHSVIVEEEDA